MDNRQIIPYSLYLSVKYYTYINIKVCASVQSVKYIYKYIYKGNDRTTLRLTNGDKVTQYLQGCYIGPFKAIWRLLKFFIYNKSPLVIQLTVYLLGEQPIYFQPTQGVFGYNKELFKYKVTLCFNRRQLVDIQWRLIWYPYLI